MVYNSSLLVLYHVANFSQYISTDASLKNPYLLQCVPDGSYVRVSRSQQGSGSDSGASTDGVVMRTSWYLHRHIRARFPWRALVPGETR
jgi:hypothetical protein